MLILPGNPLFDLTLATVPPPNLREVQEQQGKYAFMVADHESGILRPSTGAELADYLYGGEYEERMRLIGINPDEI